MSKLNKESGTGRPGAFPLIKNLCRYVLAAAFVAAAAPLFSQPEHIETIENPNQIFRFRPGRLMFYADYHDNLAKARLLAKEVRENIDEIRAGDMIIRVEGYSTSYGNTRQNLRAAANRSNQVKSYLIMYAGVKEENFLTKNFADNWRGMNDIAAVAYLEPAKTSAEVPVEVPDAEKETEPVAKEPDGIADGEKGAGEEIPAEIPVAGNGANDKKPVEVPATGEDKNPVEVHVTGEDKKPVEVAGNGANDKKPVEVPATGEDKKPVEVAGSGANDKKPVEVPVTGEKVTDGSAAVTPPVTEKGTDDSEKEVAAEKKRDEQVPEKGDETVPEKGDETVREKMMGDNTVKVKVKRVPWMGEKGTFMPKIAIKTNLLALAGVMPDFRYYTPLPNLEVEWYFAERWSLAGTGAFAKWPVGSSKFFGTSAWSIEPRVWPWGDGRFRWLYAGIYGQWGDFDNQRMYIDDFGHTGAFAGAGLSLGAAIPMTDRLMLEVGIRGGWQWRETDVYSWEPPHYYYDYTDKTNKWGVTGVKLSLMYRFGKRR